ncbi:ankyrin repeat domain-containing protein [Paracoccus simplex]|uniref:Ankyrin repeat domain-containing protein n=1 Tax=Paracoccus simplex TaxID=2086346 RepID=A0ABV7RW69_9RHOB
MRRAKLLSSIALMLGLMSPAAHGFIVLKWEPSPTPQQSQVEASPPADTERTRPVMQSKDRETFDQRWAQAPEEIRAIATEISNGAVPDDQALAALGTEALSRGYHAPALDFTRDGQPVQYLATLLQEAVMAYNLEAAQALLAQGVDPNVNHAEALFMAIERRTPSERDFMLFPDFDASLPIVQAMLDAGADPDTQQYGFRHVTPLSLAEGHRNLGAMIALINAGADPWLRPNFPGGGNTDSLLESLAFGAGNHATAETLFRVLRGVKLPSGSPDQIDQFLHQLDSVVETFAMGSGPDSRHTAWRLDQVLILAGKALDRTTETDRIRARLSEFSYQADGGWYLAEDEIHSRYNAPLSVPDRGNQIWGP